MWKPEPNLTIGNTIDLFGIKATITDVVPYNDYIWLVELTSVNGGNAVESFNILIPTDFHTVTGRNAWVD